MWNVVVFVLVAAYATLTGADSCDSRGENFYYDIGCKPYYQKSDSSCECPEGFNCPKVKPGTCRYRGNYYKNQESIKGTQKCLFCTCSVEKKTASSSFSCAIADCAQPEEPKENCYILPIEDQCCGTKEICGTKPKPCEVGGVEYSVGTYFTPKNTCWSCLCTEEFDGTFREPYCKRQKCDTEIWQNEEAIAECAPVFNKNYTPCCPSNFVCENRIISLKPISKASSKKPNVCKLGKRRFKKNDKFKVKYTNRFDEENSATCVCDLPPYPTCFM